MFVVTVVFEIAPQHADGFQARVRRQAEESLRIEPECHRFDVCVASDGPGRVLLYELYSDADAFQAHLASAHYAAFSAEVAPVLVDKTVETWSLS